VLLAPEDLASDLWIDPAAYPHVEPYPPCDGVELKAKEVLLPTSEYHCMRRYPFLVHVIHGLIDPAIGIYGPAQMAAPEPCSVSLPSYYGRLDLCTYLSQWSVQLADRF